MQQPADEEKNVVLTIFDGTGQKMVSAPKGQRLLDVLRRQGLYIGSPCGGRGTCGKCRVELRQGRVLAAGAAEETTAMTEAGAKVLACRSWLTENCAVDVSAAQERGFAANGDFVATESDEIDTGFATLRFAPPAGDWDAGRSAVEEIRRGLARPLMFSQKALRQVSYWLGDALQTGQAAPTAEQPLFLTVGGNRVAQARTEEAATLYGIGIDLGTTTIALSLVDLLSFSKDVCGLLYNQDVHVGFVRSDFGWHGEKHVLYEEPVCVAAKEALTLADLPGKPRIDYHTDDSFKNLIDTWWSETFLQPPTVGMTVGYIDVCRSMVANGLGYAIVPYSLLDGVEPMHRIILQDKNGQPLLRKTWMLYHKEMLELKLVRLFLEFAESVDYAKLI